MATRAGGVTFRWYMETGPEFDDFVRARSAALLRTAFALAGDYGQQPSPDGSPHTRYSSSPGGHARGWAWR